MNGNVKFIDGGVTSPEGFLASGVLCKIKESRKTCDVALIYSEKICNAAAVFTQNRVKAEPVKLTKKNIQDGKLQAVIANSGNANCCTGTEGEQVALKMAEAVSSVTGCKPSDVAVCSTGVIGMQLPFEKINAKIQELKNSLSKEGHKDARCAIMTTDTKYKECALEFSVGGKKCHIGTMAKGSGMIHINLGTMLGFITTDCAISSAMLEKALKESVKTTYNCVSVDGDTSTNDTLLILANGQAINKGEAGLTEWIESINRRYQDWDVYMSEYLIESGDVSKEELKNHPQYSLIDIGEHVRNLKEFLHLRDTHPAFAEVKAQGAVGIPCFVTDDGRVSFEPDEFLTDYVADGAACSLDGKGC